MAEGENKLYACEIKIFWLTFWPNKRRVSCVFSGCSFFLILSASCFVSFGGIILVDWFELCLVMDLLPLIKSLLSTKEGKNEKEVEQ